MWQVSGKLIDAGLFKPFEPVEILYGWRVLRSFTHKNREGQLCYSPIGATLITSSIGLLSFRSRLVWFTNSRLARSRLRSAPGSAAYLGCGRAAFRRRSRRMERWSFRRLPANVLPKPGSMLWPSLEPLLSRKPA